MPKKITLYVSDADAEVVKQAKKIFKREDYSLSRFLVSELRRYNRLHEPGNPQQRIDVIAQRGEAYQAPLICENPDCQAEVDQLTECVVLSGAKRRYCDKCIAAKSKPPYNVIKKIGKVIQRRHR